jgi:hypothetical protein
MDVNSVNSGEGTDTAGRDSGRLFLLAHRALIAAGIDTAAVYRRCGFTPDSLGGADVDLDRDGGFGISLSAQFRNEAAGVNIEPFITYDVPSDTGAKTISGTRTSVEDIENGTMGVRVSWLF